MNSANAKVAKWVAIFLGTCLWSVTMVKSGLVRDYGMGFWGANGHDGIWHIALINQLSHFSLHMPVFAGYEIKNYHLGFSVLATAIVKTTTLSAHIVYFQILPPIFAFLIGYLVYEVVYAWKKSSLPALFSTISIYILGSFGWLFNVGESGFWAQQNISTLINPPYALSLVMILISLRLIQKKYYKTAGIMLGLLSFVKVYAALILCAWIVIESIKNSSIRKTAAIAILISAVIFFFEQDIHSSLIIFQPGWFLEQLMAPDHLNWPKFFSALNTYRVSHNFIKGIPAFIVAGIVFAIGNMGVRVIALTNLRHWKSFSIEDRFFWLISLIGFVPPLLFIQSGTAWNTIQFFYYSLFSLSILTGITISQISNKTLKSGLILITIVTAAFGLKDSLQNYLPSRPPAKLSLQELNALEVLRKAPEGVVLTYPFNKSAADKAISNPPRSLYVYESSGYVSAFADKQVFLEDEVNLNITGFPWQERRKQVENFFSSPSLKFLQENNISYIYIPKDLYPHSSIPNTQTFFENSEILILSPVSTE